MFCSITKEPVQEPVISKKTGHLYEKRIIKKYLEENHKCPITGEDMTEDDLIELKTGTSTLSGKPRPPTATSIPSLLTLFQNEWDSVMLETYQLKQQYQKVRQELSHALYQHDAACRVIARLTKERNEAREALINLQQTLNAQGPAEDTEMTDVSNGIGMTAEIIENMSNTSNALSKVRRKRKPGPDVATHDEVKSFTNKIEIPSLHSTNPSGILSVDLLDNTLNGKKVTWALTGGKDGQINIVDYNNDGKIINNEKAHSKKINQVQWYTKQDKMPGAFFTASADKTVKFWNCDVDSEDYAISNKYAFKGHSAEITSMSIHATGDYFASASADSTWSLVDLATNQLIVKVSKDDIESGFSCSQFHPDGLIYATGTDNDQIRIWDVKSANNVASFSARNENVGKITSISFAENGYHLASCADNESIIRIWDLRKLKNIYNIEFEDPSVEGLQSVSFDPSAQYLAGACGGDIRIYLIKQWTELCHLSGHSDNITSLCWGTNSKSIASVGMDRSLRFYGV
ncbi:PRP19/PSO4 pre-mRNA processing factor 19 [Neocallimastix lanati (nom. inval.)]|jgi:pre-mRNA-processing factor 19|uniref:Pre-mRNA-processing factor 19 n=1 Tax=Neocallimastix californiae TaxID=1754190 RepID=A0A1Y2AET9_9FUNG|nr:PRP19/PSO4 pre-mRNA processing factor 19 [Neocallimastix sp. JGI-2020a]ORY20800.1 pre-mRNA-processing factor 19 [Neocallimastix californiae]|eukprot:ORY20800.1 pre-mRNA-processing factor 19 [Neocallimastix californiae]